MEVIAATQTPRAIIDLSLSLENQSHKQDPLEDESEKLGISLSLFLAN